MDIREVRVTVPDRRVLMDMTVRLCSIPVKRMLVLMMLIVNVTMFVRERVVLMFVCMAFGEVNPDANTHQ